MAGGSDERWNRVGAEANDEDPNHVDSRRRRRLEGFRSLYRPDCTEGLRLDYLEELFHQHRDYLDEARDEEAAARLRELEQVAGAGHDGSSVETVQTQTLWWVRALADAQERAAGKGCDWGIAARAGETKTLEG